MINHILQRETSHSQCELDGVTRLGMEESEIFRANLLRLMKERDLKAAPLSRKAGLNPRAVKDIEEGRSGSPKLSTVFKLAKALEVDPGEMLGLGPRRKIHPELAAYLEQYDESEQERILQALSFLPR